MNVTICDRCQVRLEPKTRRIEYHLERKDLNSLGQGIYDRKVKQLELCTQCSEQVENDILKRFFNGES